ncbi:amino acid/polyamine transporter I [Nemania sp. FL0916]|nr:amino acid/polyamine transporter I [Nemania sp. FL0916]
MSVVGPEPPGHDSRDREIDDHASIHSALISRSDEGEDGQPRPRPQRKGPYLTPLNCLALVIGLQIGSGIFSAPSLIAREVGSPAEALGVFVTAGLLVWTGAASFVELGLLVPSNGGIQEYLRASWGDFIGHLFPWIWVGVVKPAGNAAISNIFADYLLRAFRSSDTTSPWMTKTVALGCIVVLTLINCLGATAGAKAANIFMVLKLAALGSIIIAGFATYVLGYGNGVPTSDSGWFGQEQLSLGESDVWKSLGNVSTAVFAALFCYGGWETAGFFAGDMKSPAKDLPRVINGAMMLVIIGFFLMNLSLYVCLPLDVIRESNTVAVEFANRTVGPLGGLIFTVIVAISAMGAVNANMFGIAKLCVAAAQRAYFPPILANLHCNTARDEPHYLRRSVIWPFQLPVLAFAKLTRRLRWERSVPVFALLLNGILTSLFITVGSLTGLITLIEIIKSSCYMMSVLGIFILRRRADKQMPTGSHPTLKTYRTWIGNPIIFASVSGMLVIRGTISAPLQGPVILFIGVIALAVLYRRLGSPAFELPPRV